MALDNSIIQAGLISWLKNDSTITAQTSDIREYDWQGTNFTYPNIRVQIHSFSPETGECAAGDCRLSIYIYSDAFSSKQCNSISGIINTEINHKSRSITTALGTVRFVNIKIQDMLSAVREDMLTWRSELVIQVKVEQ